MFDRKNERTDRRCRDFAHRGGGGLERYLSLSSPEISLRFFDSSVVIDAIGWGGLVVGIVKTPNESSEGLFVLTAPQVVCFWHLCSVRNSVLLTESQ